MAKWPWVKQVFRLCRWRDAKPETAYGISSVGWSPEVAGRLLEFSRRHWGIENSLHYIRDVTYLEDRCRTRNRNKAQVLSAFRNTAIMHIRPRFACVPEGLEYFGEHRAAVIAAVLQRTE